ncbi:hypothetical protein BVX94_01915 [bacterium B17]|nr:hypothetical protein BVX94_01915 [bacterium B17]
MNCEEIRNQMLLAQSGELPASEIESLKHHLENCEECQNYSQLLDLIAANSRPYDTEGPSQATMARIHDTMSDTNESKSIIMFPGFVRILAYAAVFAMLIGGALLLPESESQTAGIDNLKDLIAIASEDESYTMQSNGAQDCESEIRVLAEQLLKYQEGNSVYFIEEVFLPLEPEPTALQFHNTPESPQEKCV